MTEHFFNTTGMKGNELKEADQKALTQEQVIMEWFKLRHEVSWNQLLNGFISMDYRYGPTEVQKKALPNAPITSVRRAMTNLTNQGKLEKTDFKVKGMYGRKEFTWRLAK